MSVAEVGRSLRTGGNRPYSNSGYVPRGRRALLLLASVAVFVVICLGVMAFLAFSGGEPEEGKAGPLGQGTRLTMGGGNKKYSNRGDNSSFSSAVASSLSGQMSPDSMNGAKVAAGASPNPVESVIRLLVRAATNSVTNSVMSTSIEEESRVVSKVLRGIADNSQEEGVMGAMDRIVSVLLTSDSADRNRSTYRSSSISTRRRPVVLAGNRPVGTYLCSYAKPHISEENKRGRAQGSSGHSPASSGSGCSLRCPTMAAMLHGRRGFLGAGAGAGDGSSSARLRTLLDFIQWHPTTRPAGTNNNDNNGDKPADGGEIEDEEEWFSCNILNKASPEELFTSDIVVNHHGPVPRKKAVRSSSSVLRQSQSEDKALRGKERTTDADAAVDNTNNNTIPPSSASSKAVRYPLLTMFYSGESSFAEGKKAKPSYEAQYDLTVSFHRHKDGKDRLFFFTWTNRHRDEFAAIAAHALWYQHRLHSIGGGGENLPPSNYDELRTAFASTAIAQSSAAALSLFTEDQRQGIQRAVLNIERSKPDIGESSGGPVSVLTKALVSEWSKRLDAVAVFVSRCKKGGRDRVIRELMKHYTVHSFGNCVRTHTIEQTHPSCLKGASGGGSGGGHKPPDGASRYPQKLCVFSKYKYVLALDNTREEGYVTEKVYHGLLAGAVPLYDGAPDAWRFLPGGPAAESIIALQDYASTSAAEVAPPVASVAKRNAKAPRIGNSNENNADVDFARLAQTLKQIAAGASATTDTSDHGSDSSASVTAPARYLRWRADPAHWGPFFMENLLHEEPTCSICAAAGAIRAFHDRL